MQADIIRKKIETKGYTIADTVDVQSTHIYRNESEKQNELQETRIAIFGSGELSSVGRSIHEHLIHAYHAPVHITLLPTPAGYEDNPFNWYRKLSRSLKTGLHNYAPEVTICKALRSDGDESTNSHEILKPLLDADYIHTGAGSPTYAVRHLKNSLALTYLKQRIDAHIPTSIASAASIAFGKVVLPVYELYFAGEDLHWDEGLDFFSRWGLNLSFITHFNNTEGGRDVDTRYAYMGKRRFTKLLDIIPLRTNLVGIDEHTALIINLTTMKGYVMGKGNITLITSDVDGKKISPGYTFDLSIFSE